MTEFQDVPPDVPQSEATMYEPPDGFRVEWVEDAHARLATPEEHATRTCRRTRCVGAPVMAFLRANGWWLYCADHLYGRRIVAGSVQIRRWVKESDDGARESLSAFRPRRIYVASSWQNPIQPSVVTMLRELGNEVYDFRNPRPGDNGFHWSAIDPDWRDWHPASFRDALRHPIAQAGFRSDFDAMQWADTFVLLLPSGRWAHLEAGWAIGAGKPTCIVLHEDKFEPELMYLCAAEIVTNLEDAAVWVESLRTGAVPDAA